MTASKFNKDELQIRQIFPDLHALLAELFATFTPTTWPFLPVTPVQFMTLIGTTETALGIAGLLVPPLRVTLAKVHARTHARAHTHCRAHADD